MGFQAEWRPPFVGTLMPVSYVPFEVAKIASLLVAFTAIVMGHLMIFRGGGTRRSLIGALFVYPVAGLFILFLPPVARVLSQVIPFYQELAFFALIATPVAFILVHLVAGFRRVRKTGGVIWRPVLGAMLGYFNVALIALLAFSLYSKGRHNWDMAVCSNNLKQIGYVLREYANESKGAFYPPLSSQPGVLMFSPEGIPHQDMIAPRLTCPLIRYAQQPTTGPASPFDDQSYFYLGYAVRDDDDVQAFAQAYRKQIAKGGTFEGDLVVENSEGTRVLHRLSERVWEALRTEGTVPTNEMSALTLSKIPVLIERDLGHINADNEEGPNRIRGAWVLYFGDDIRFVQSGTWPITEKTQRILAELAQSPPPK
ncbi:MAG: hypothetical protein NTZ09_18980 [Candidatus Hydrogenedentes bacterium]|nr:hypothetical protein [Candidatus Hydrogenedentota bacterium]